MTIISASTLCAAPRNLKPGIPRSYNIAEFDTDAMLGRLHQRQMVNMLFNLPAWGPGHFSVTNRSFIDFDICKPLLTRPPQLDEQLALDRADKLLGARQWANAIAVLDQVSDPALKRPFLVKALTELGEPRRTINTLWPPLTDAEAVILADAILEAGSKQESEAFLRLDLVVSSSDASVRDVSHRLRERKSRWAKE